MGKTLIKPKYRIKGNRRSKSERRHDDNKHGKVFNGNKKQEKNNKIQSRIVNINRMGRKKWNVTKKACKNKNATG